METRNATVTKTFNSYTVVTCTMKESAQCQLEPAFQAFFFQFGVSPSFPLPAESSTRIIGLKNGLVS